MSKHTTDILNAGSKFVRQRYTGKSGIGNIAKDLHLLHTMMNTEDKHVYTLQAAQTTVSPTAPLVVGLGTMAQGTADGQREGDSIKMTRLDTILQFSWGCGTTATTYNQQYCWWLVRNLKTPSTNGTVAFAITDFLNNDGFGNTSSLSFRNAELTENFSIIDEGIVDLLLPYGSGANINETKTIRSSVPVKFHQVYSGAAATTIVDNMVFLVVVALNGTNAGGGSSVSIQHTEWYIDN